MLCIAITVPDPKANERATYTMCYRSYNTCTTTSFVTKMGRIAWILLYYTFVLIEGNFCWSFPCHLHGLFHANESKTMSMSIVYDYGIEGPKMHPSNESLLMCHKNCDNEVFSKLGPFDGFGIILYPPASDQANLL